MMDTNKAPPTPPASNRNSLLQMLPSVLSGQTSGGAKAAAAAPPRNYFEPFTREQLRNSIEDVLKIIEDEDGDGEDNWFTREGTNEGDNRCPAAFARRLQ
jgi:hypothetical protein